MGLRQILIETRDFLSGFSAPDNFFGLGGFAPTAANVTVNEVTAMQSAAVFGCVRIISGAIAKTPLHVYEKLPNGGRRIASEHPYEYILSKRFSDEMESFMAKETGSVHLLLRGNAYYLKLRNKQGKVVGFDLLSPFSTSIYRNPKAGNKLIYKFVDWAGCDHVFEQEDIIHIRNISFDGLVGLSPIQQYARESIGLDLGLRNYGARYIANGATASGILAFKQKVSPDDRKKYEKDIIEAHSGTNAHRALVLGAEATWQNLSITPEEAQFLQTRGFQRNEIAAGIYGVPPSLLGDHEQTKAGVAEQNAALLSTTLGSWIARWEGAFNAKLFSIDPRYSYEDATRYEVAFDTTDLDRYTVLETLKTLATGRQWGLLTANEGRVILGQNPYDMDKDADPADQLYMPVNMAPMAEKPEPEPTTAPSNPDPAGTKPEQQSGEKVVNDTARGLFRRVFRDAFNRIITKETRDERLVTRTFMAPLAAIADYYCLLRDSNFRPGDDLPEPAAAFVRQYVGALSKRALDWKQEDFEPELTRAITEVGGTVLKGE